MTPAWSPGDCLQLRHRRRLDLPLELKRYRLFHARLGSISASRLHGKNRSEDTARRPRVGEELRLPLTGRGWSTTALQPIASTCDADRRKPFGYIGFHHPS